MEAMSSVDTIGVAVEISGKEEITLKDQTKRLRRYLCLVDDSLCAVSITLWGDLSTGFKVKEGDVVVVKGARISDYGGKSLNAAKDHASLHVNLPLPRGQAILQWYERFIKQDGDPFSSLRWLSVKTNRFGGGSGEH